MLRDAHLGHHVVLPNDVGLILVLVGLGRVGAVVFSVVEAVGVEADDLAPVIDIPETVPSAIRRAADSLLGPIVHATLRKLGIGILPEEFPGLLVKTEQAAEVDCSRVSLDVAGAVVGADENFAVGDDRISVRLRAQLGGPATFCFSSALNLMGMFLPSECCSGRPAPPLRPVEGTHVPMGNFFHGQGSGIVFPVRPRTRGQRAKRPKRAGPSRGSRPQKRSADEIRRNVETS